MTFLPSRAVASLVSSTPSRGGGSSAISALAASTRNFGLVVRAGAPRRSQASSLRSRLRRRVRRLPRRAPARPGPARTRRSRPRRVHLAVVHLPGPLAHGVEEPPVVGDDDERAGPFSASGRAGAGRASRRPRRRGGWSARRAAARRARRRAARPARPGGARRRTAARPGRRGRSREQLGHDRAGPRIGLPRGRLGGPPPGAEHDLARRFRSAGPAAADSRSAGRPSATRPSSGAAVPASSVSSVDLPAPLRPTTPIRSPAETPSETPSSSPRCAYALVAFSRLIRFIALPRRTPRRRPAPVR